MSELSQLIGVHGAIDRAVLSDPARRNAVSLVLPIYERPEAQWFDEFVAWTQERADTDEPVFPDSIGAALSGLAEFRSPRPRMLARRLFAVAATTRAFPEWQTEDDTLHRLLLDALEVEGIAPPPEEGGTERLLEILSSDDFLLEFGDLDLWWDAVTRAASTSPERIGPRPCTGRLVNVTLPSGSTIPVASLRAAFVSTSIGFDEACSFIEPSHWPGCSDFWCEMVKIAEPVPGLHRYHEHVSTDCGQALAWTVSCELDFRFEKRQNEASAVYRLSDNQPQKDLLVDEGMMLIEALPTGGISVVTTKRVAFNRALSGEGLALLMCALGYAAIVEDFVFNCAAYGSSGQAFPADEPVGLPQGGEDTLDEAVAALKACIDDWAQAAKASADRIANGTYTADAAVQDMTWMYSRMVRDGTAALGTGIRLANRAADRARRAS